MTSGAPGGMLITPQTIALLEALEHPALLQDGEGAPLHGNGALYGWAAHWGGGEEGGRRLLDALQDDLEGRIRSRCRTGQEAGNGCRLELETPAGGLRVLRCRCRTLEDREGGQSPLLFWSIRDVTDDEGQQLPAPVESSPFREMFEHTPAVQLLLEPDSYRVVDANAAACRFYGLSRDEMRGLLFDSLRTPGSEPFAPDPVLPSAHPLLLRQKTTFGEERVVEVLVNPISGEDGPLFFLIAHDVTDRSASERTLRESEERFRAIFARSPVPLLIASEETGQTLDVNPATASLLSREVTQLIGSALRKLLRLPGEVSELGDGAITPLVEASPVEAFCLLPDGSEREVELLAHRLTLRGRPVLLVTLHDLTGRREAEAAALEASRLETAATLAAGVAHDINNLMATILGHSEMLLLDEDLPREKLAPLQAISSSATAAGRLAHHLLAYAHGGRYQPRSTDLKPLLEKIVAEMEGEEASQFALRALLADTLPTVHADVRQIELMVRNVLVNAAEASEEEGGGEVLLDAEPVELAESAPLAATTQIPPGRYLRLRITDRGKGIEPEILPRVIEPFFSTKFTGRGLGLSAAFGIARSHEGGLDIESTPGEGTTVTIYLPAEPAGD